MKTPLGSSRPSILRLPIFFGIRKKDENRNARFSGRRDYKAAAILSRLRVKSFSGRDRLIFGPDAVSGPAERNQREIVAVQVEVQHEAARQFVALLELFG